MIDGLKPYPAMKDSGMSWLGMVPEAWNVLRGRHLFEIKKRIAGELGHAILSVTQAGLRVKNVTSGEGQVSLDYSKYQIVQPGEFVMNSMDLLTGGVGIADAAGVTSPDYRVFLIRDDGQCRDRYVLHVFRTLYGNRGFYAWGQGSAQLGRWRLPRKRFNEFPFPVPPLVEQNAIVRFLDHADGRIRRYIRAKQKLIKLLEEQKHAIIHRAVTRGLDPNVRLNASGVEWLGDVPAHWEVMPLRRAAISRCDGPFGSGLKSGHYTDSGVRVVRLQNIGHAEFREGDSAYISQAYYATLGDHDVEEGDLLIAGLGDDRHPAGRACVAPASILPAMVKADCFRFRLRRDRLDPAFAALQLTATAADASAQLSTGATRQRTNLQSTGSRRMAIPSLSEQWTIVEFVAKETASLTLTMRIAEREMELIREYQHRLATDVVTGKLDVREAAARLPSEIEEAEPLDAEIDPQETMEQPDARPEEAEV